MKTPAEKAEKARRLMHDATMLDEWLRAQGERTVGNARVISERPLASFLRDKGCGPIRVTRARVRFTEGGAQPLMLPSWARRFIEAADELAPRGAKITGTKAAEVLAGVLR